MSDSEHSTITYLTEMEYSDIGSPGVDGPPSPDYVPGPEAPPSPIYIPYVPEPEYPIYATLGSCRPAEDNRLPCFVALPAIDRTDSIFFTHTHHFPKHPSSTTPQILSPPISPTRTEFSRVVTPRKPRLASPTLFTGRGDFRGRAARHMGGGVRLWHHDEWDGLWKPSRDRTTTIEGVNRLRSKDDRLITHLAIMVEKGGLDAREAWGFSMSLSDDTCSHVLALLTTVVKRALISGLQASTTKTMFQFDYAQSC
ncbi:hypothetical protein Tco_1079752 [Tanacetum coccineum]|uniref:Uncharacterized protein n=1 Tax=Tanacetum coccineum TaxID=301880 RepID=A0ABQ5HUD8_9ASTR